MQKRKLPDDVPRHAELPDGSLQGPNDYDRTGYVGPCRPDGVHHYVFSLYALDTKLGLPPRAPKMQVQNAMNGPFLASGELIGCFQH